MICVNTPDQFPTIPHFNVSYGVSRWPPSDRLADTTTRVPNSSKLASQRSSGLPKGQPSTPSASCCNKSPKVRGWFGPWTAVCTACSLSHSSLVCAFQRFLIHGRGVSTKLFAVFWQAWWSVPCDMSNKKSTISSTITVLPMFSHICGVWTSVRFLPSRAL